MRHLLRLLRRDVIDPDVIGSIGAVVVIQQLRPIAAVGKRIAAQRVHALLQRQRLRAPARHVVQIDVGVAINIGRPRQRLAIGRKRSCAQPPLLVGQPVNLLGCDVEQSDIVVAVLRVRGDEDRLAIGRDVIRFVSVLACMLRQVCALAAGEIEHEDVGVLPGGVRLRINQELAIARENRARVAQLLGRVLRQMAHVARGNVHQLDLKARAGLGLGDVRDLPPVGRPRRLFFRALRRSRQVHHVAGLGRHQEDVPLLVAIVIGDVGDPGAVGRPHRLRLPLIADGQLRRPSAGRRNQPEIITSADVGDEGDLLAVGRPR